MTKITYLDGVAIYKLIYYSPCLIASIWVAARHGFQKSSGWIFLSIFAVLRLIGAAAQLATISSKSDTPYTIAAVTTSIGLSPLLLASLGLLARTFYSILEKPWNTIFSLVLLKAIQTPAAVALILCIVGATSASTPAQIDSQSTVHIGIILFAVVLGALIILTLFAFMGYKRKQRGEGALILAVALALPFLTVRIIYSLLAVFSHDAKFNAISGSTTVNLFMAVLPECVVVAIYLIAGIKSEAIPKDQQSSTAGGNLRYRLGRGDFGTGRLGLLSLGAAVMQAVNGKIEEDGERKDSQTVNLPRNRRDDTSRGQGYGMNAV